MKEPISFEIPATLQQQTTHASMDDMVNLKRKIHALNATLIAHYYTDPEVQQLAELSGGFIGDSLAMAQYGHASDQSILIVAGVKFMGETAKILNPEKRVLMPTIEATCSLDLGCPIKEFSAFCDEHPDRTVVVYANTSAAVKARADWVVTSSNALKIISHLDDRGEKIIWGPDKHLGRYIQQETGADMLLWQGSCIVHEEFKKQGVLDLKALHPKAAILVHPESPADVVALADVVGSTSKLLNASQTLKNDTFIVATDRGIFYKMQQLSPNKTFIEAPTAGHGATCKSCAHCPWMAMNRLSQLSRMLDTCQETNQYDVSVDENIRVGAYRSLARMLQFSSS